MSHNMFRELTKPVRNFRVASIIRSIVTSSSYQQNGSETLTDSYYKKQGAKQQLEHSTKPDNWDSAKPFDEIPGPKPLPILGNAHRFLWGEFRGMDFVDVYKLLYNQYGSILVLKGMPGMKPMVSIYDPDDVEFLYRNEGIWPLREVLPSMVHYRKNVRPEIYDEAPGVLTVHGEEWYNARSIVNPILMQPRSMQNYIGSLDSVAKDFIELMKKLSKSDDRNEMPDDFEYHIQKWALESVTMVAVDNRLGCFSDNAKPETKKLVESIKSIFETFFVLDYTPQGYFYKKFKTKIYKNFISDMDTVTFTIKKYIDEAIEIKRNSTDIKSIAEQSVFERLLLVNSKLAMTMTMDMIMAGVDTTTKTAGAALYFLAKSKEAQTKLREELKKNLPTPSSPLTKEILAELHYLKAVVKETMRLAPIGLGNLRTLQKDTVIAGYQIPKGISVTALNLLMSQSETHYKRATEFIPDRWLRITDSELSHKNTHSFVALPFGFGPRSCIGRRLATLELEVIIANVIRNFVLDWQHKDMTFKSTLLYGFTDPLKCKMVPVSN